MTTLTPPSPTPNLDKPYTLLDFQRMFPDEAACIAYLYSIRWPTGFKCPKCGETRAYRLRNQPDTVECANHHRTSVTAGTVMHRTRQPLTLWFYAAYLVSTLTPGISALQLQRQLGIGRYETAFQLLHKLRAGLVDPDREKLHTEVEIDESYVGGAEEGRPGRGAETKALVVCAVEAVRWLDTTSHRQEVETPFMAPGKPPPGSPGVDMEGTPGIWRRRAGRVRLAVIPDASGETLIPWIEANVAKTKEDEVGRPQPTLIFTDGWPAYSGLASRGYLHLPILQTSHGVSTGKWLPLVHLIISNLKRWLLGTHKGAVSPKHLQAYLNEFTFRFNRRFWRGPAFLRSLGLATSAEDWPEYDTLYHAGDEGGWVHPNPLEGVGLLTNAPTWPLAGRFGRR